MHLKAFLILVSFFYSLYGVAAAATLQGADLKPLDRSACSIKDRLAAQDANLYNDASQGKISYSGNIEDLVALTERFKSTIESEAFKAAIWSIVIPGADLGTLAEERKISLMEASWKSVARYPVSDVACALNDLEYFALRMYLTSSYSFLNKALREGRTSNASASQKTELENYLPFERLLNSSLEKIPLYQNNSNKNLVYRKIRLNQDALAVYQSGALVRWEAFTSSSADADIKGDFGPVCFYLSSKSGHDITKLTPEKEVLFPSRTTFKVLERDDRRQKGAMENCDTSIFMAEQ